MSEFVRVGDLKPGTKIVYSYGELNFTTLAIEMHTKDAVVGQRVLPMKSNREKVELLRPSGTRLGTVGLDTSVKLR
jgi:hypothetical protein